MALLTLDLTSSGEHCGTIFLTSAGIVDDERSDYPEKKQIIKQLYLPYQYRCTPEIEGDIHSDDEMPEDIASFFKGI